MHEIARQVLGERKDIPLSRDEWKVRQQIIYKRQIEGEKQYTGTLFLDRGSIDAVAYSRHLLGYVPFNEQSPDYHLVCNLERLPFENDGLRVESGDEEAQIIHNKIMETYVEYGYSLLYLPVFDAPTLEESISKRADHLLSKLEEVSNGGNRSQN